MAGALANMANHEATSFSMVNGPCLGVLNRLLRTASHEGLQEQVRQRFRLFRSDQTSRLAAQAICSTTEVTYTLLSSRRLADYNPLEAA